jgi:hypothetical protein
MVAIECSVQPKQVEDIRRGMYPKADKAYDDWFSGPQIPKNLISPEPLQPPLTDLDRLAADAPPVYIKD